MAEAEACSAAPGVRRLFTARGLILWGSLVLALSWRGPCFADAAASTPACGVAYMTVWGVVAPVSTFGLIKNLKDIPGVDTVEFDLRHGLATIHLQPGAVVSDAQLRAAVRSASYTPRGIRRLPSCAGRSLP